MEEIEDQQGPLEPPANPEDYEPIFPPGTPTSSRVVIGWHETIIPANVCCCCLGPSDTTFTAERTSYGYYVVATTRTHQWMTFPYCRACRRHRSGYLLRRVLAVIVPSLLAAGVALFLAMTGKVDLGLVALGQLVLALALYVAYALLFPMKELGPEHGARYNPIDIAGSRHEEIHLDIANERYAYLLAYANGGIIESRVIRFHDRHTSVLRGLSAAAIVAWIFGLWFLLAMLVGMLGPAGP